ncbi:hypothetical protein BC937DRAFT_95314 [Endogone sp. FLAS-F59071]|nr:hypothetical protein BC937DRAFT_95314 [Endogone sp. FLAS-F59071]|eukprot:RUS20390.1 hypothetical protein BC937DRAFT_95314 [Endogone sp. FLAS-F59071]
MESEFLSVLGETLLNVGLPLLSVAISVSFKLITGGRRHPSSIHLPEDSEVDIDRPEEAGRRHLFYAWVQLILVLVEIALSAGSNYIGEPAFAIVSSLVALFTWGYALLLCIGLVSSLVPRISREDLPIHLLFIYLVMLLLSGARIWESNEVRDFDTINLSVNTILLGTVFVMPSIGHVFPESGTERPISHEVYASIFSLMTFEWVYPLLYLGYQRPLEYEDLWELPDSLRASENWQEFEQIGHGPLWKRILLSNIHPISMQAFMGFLSILSNFAAPFFLQRLLQYFENPSKQSQKDAYFYVTAMFLSTLGRPVMLSQAYYYGRRWCIRLTEALNSAIYAKALRRVDMTGVLNGDEGKKSNADAGKLMSMMYIDTEEIAEIASYVFHFCQAPLEIAIGLVYLYYLVGISSIYGVGVMLVMILFNNRIGKNYGKVQGELKKVRDKRISLDNEFVQGIRIIKYFAWENKITERSLESRNMELNQLLKVKLWGCGMRILWMATPLLVPIATFFSFTKLYGGTLDAATAFTSLAIFAMLREPLSAIPEYMVEIISASAGLQRISAFLDEEEIPKEDQDFSESHPIIGFENASFQWHSASVDTTKVTLQDINLEFPRGQLSIICGPVGSGKTSLLLALLGEMKLVSGRKFLPRPIESVAFVSQQVWLQNASIRENITFGLPFDKPRYEEVLEICALNPDCELWRDRDLTEIGEKGVTLSGGQKSRVALARAVYSKASCILLDDILSAVDSHTAQYLVKKCLSGTLMQYRTQIMATNHTKLLDMASYYVFMDRGKVKCSGSMRDMIEGGFLENNIWIEQNNQIGEAVETLLTTDNAAKNIQPSDGAPRKLIEKETSSTGGVLFNTYALYLTSNGGYLFWLMFLTALILVRFLSVAESWWLKIWSDAYPSDEASAIPVNLNASTSLKSTPVAGVFRSWTFEQTPVNADYYILIYAFIQFLSIFLFIIGKAIEVLGSLRASRILYGRLLGAVLHTPLRWSFVTPVGRIMLRFSKVRVTLPRHIFPTSALT